MARILAGFRPQRVTQLQRRLDGVQPVPVRDPWSSTVPFQLDDVSVVRLDTPPGLLPEATFEDDSHEGWFVVDGREGELSIVAPGADSDSALRITGRTQTNTGPAADIVGKLEAGATYRVQADLRYTGGNAAQGFQFTLCDDAFSYGICFNGVRVVAKQAEWTSIDAEFVADVPNPAVGSVDDWAYAFFETDWKASPEAADLVDFEIDNVSLVKVEKEPEVPVEGAESPVERVQTKPVGDHNPLMGTSSGPTRTTSSSTAASTSTPPVTTSSTGRPSSRPTVCR
ncbi:carbohydrate binding domain-containing protein [Tessaracoccus coleopterorum]|uniref:carbohydrate binding domain-containing protein n=1 Tax=Tessaracoccus coleopterorum TaxID=2714950 RepID=UPI002F910164